MVCGTLFLLHLLLGTDGTEMEFIFFGPFFCEMVGVVWSSFVARSREGQKVAMTLFFSLATAGVRNGS